MENQLLEQYQETRTTIKNNIETIGDLVKSVNSLNETIKKFSEINGNKTDEINNLIKTLEKEAEKMSETIATLISQTKELLNVYSDFVKNVFNK